MPSLPERARAVRHAIAEIVTAHGGQWSGAVDAAVDAVLRAALAVEIRLHVGDRVCHHGVMGTIRMSKLLIDTSSSAPAVPAYAIQFDDGRLLTIEAAALDPEPPRSLPRSRTAGGGSKQQ